MSICYFVCIHHFSKKGLEGVFLKNIVCYPYTYVYTTMCSHVHIIGSRNNTYYVKMNSFIIHNMHDETVREDPHKKVFFLVVGPLRFYLPYTNGLVVHVTFLFFFFSLIIAWNGCWHFFLFLPNFWTKTAGF